MDAAELFNEFRDRHADHLVYEGPYRLAVAEEAKRELRRELRSVLNLFDDWRQRVYRFDNAYGASVVLYRPLNAKPMRWDLIATRFLSDGHDDPFAFRYADGVARNLRWRDVQRFLDRIKAR